MPTPPEPKQRSAPPAPISEVEKLMRAITRVMREGHSTTPSPFRLVSRDVLQDAMVGHDQLPALIFDDSRLSYSYQDAHNRDRIVRVEGVIVFDIQGLAKSHNAREVGFKVGELRNALVQWVMLQLLNNRRMVVQLEECGETQPTAHCTTLGPTVEVQHIPTDAPLTRTLLSVSVSLVESLDLRTWAGWTPSKLEGGPLDGATVEASIDPNALT